MLAYIQAHLTEIVIIQQALFAALAGLAQLAGKPILSKWFGTLSALDLGRLVRIASSLQAKK